MRRGAVTVPAPTPVTPMAKAMRKPSRKAIYPSLPCRWMPHSSLPFPAQRPERGSEGSKGFAVQGAQPMER